MRTPPEPFRVSPRSFRASDGTLTVVVHSPRIVATTVTGYFGDELTSAFIETFDRWAGLGGEALVAFHDWEAMTNYSMHARLTLTKWTRAHRARIRAIHFLLASPVVRAGVTIANFAVGRFMTAHAARDPFLAEYRKALSL